MNKGRVNSILKFSLKVLLSAIAIYFVFKKIDYKEFLQNISSVKIHYFVLAFLAFNISKIISAFRLNAFYKCCGLSLDSQYNVKFYYVGMLYNLFLPGAIGGDAYKVYLLRQNKDVKTKDLIAATLLDRVSGLSVLFLFTGPFILLSSVKSLFPGFDLLIVVFTILVIPVFYLGLKWVFPIFLSQFKNTMHFSFWVQAGQVLAAYFLLLSLSVNEHYFDYFALFMISSVVAVIPITLGGFGARELVMIVGHQYMSVVENTAVTFSVLFFSITALSSIIGFVFIHNIDKKPAVALNEKVNI